MKRFLAIALTTAALFCALPFCPRAAAAPHIDAGAYLLLEKEDQKVLCAANADQIMAPASTTKIMTCLVVLENCDLRETVAVPAEACGVEGSSAYLRPGEKFTVEELLYCLMLRSANDAATALAIHACGSVDAFVSEMNEKAKRLGLRNTRFANPHGLPAKDHYTTAEDLARLSCAALDNKDLERIVSTKSTVVGKEESARRLVNHNRLLFSLEGCIGVKTGYTVSAGRCLVSACRRNGTTLICVTLSCHNDWESHTRLYDYGFRTVRRYTLDAQTFSLPYAASDAPVTVYYRAYSLLASPDDSVEFITVCPHLLFPPVHVGEEVGHISVRLNGREIDRLQVLSAQERVVKEPGLWEKIVGFFRSLFHKE